ncbi:MAG: hypothetical protein ACOY90_20815 [Candidatus Zhuqueibacterota bacterium]
MKKIIKISSIVCIALISLINSSPAQQKLTRPTKPPKNLIEKDAIQPNKLHRLIPNSNNKKNLPKNVRMNDYNSTESDISLELSLDWTSCQIHRVADSSPIDIILNGTINSNCAEIWTLSAIEPIPGSLPNLYLVNDIFGDDYGNGWLNIGLQWQISIDGGPFEPMTILPDNSICYIFSPGNHIFQLSITGDVKYYQEDGYYRLQLNQSFVPQM